MLVSFEDQLGNPEGEGGFNALSFSLRTQSATAVPEPGTFGLFALGAGLLAARRKSRKLA